ncbi:MAG: hypothetical protein ABIQ35_09840 [Verrucomicrobiota bacterium]
MFITLQNHIVQTAVIQHIELVSPLIRIHITGQTPLEINYATKADAVSAFKRIAGALSAENTELNSAI